MAFKSFRINIIARVVSLCASVFLVFLLLFKTELVATVIIAGIAFVYQIYSLIQYIEKNNRDLDRFLLAIKHSDFSQTFTVSGLGESFDNLKRTFSEVIGEFHSTRAEKEEHHRYLLTVVQHVGIGLLAFDGSGDVELCNTAAKKLLQTTHLRNIRALRKLSRELVDKLFSLESGDKATVKIVLENDIITLALYATQFRLRDKQYTLVSLQNIQTELEEQEMEAWQKLIRVLTHEIMNSVTPISSLASTVNDMLSAAKEETNGDLPGKLDAGTMSDIEGALQTIQRRSSGLIHFVDAYRNLTLIPNPEFAIFPVKELFENIRNLMCIQTEEAGIELNLSVEPESLELTADTELIEQVLINLIMNAIHALAGADNGKINLEGGMDVRGRVVIKVSDNGPGMEKEVAEKIFIPFFTTKKGGSGIGLSLTRQILRMHSGNITVHSTPGQQTTFTLRF